MPANTAATVGQEELRSLRKRVAELELEKDILRKAAAKICLDARAASARLTPLLHSADPNLIYPAFSDAGALREEIGTGRRAEPP